jgi:hypothetical protein
MVAKVGDYALLMLHKPVTAVGDAGDESAGIDE